MPDSVSSGTKILRRHIWPVITTYVGAMCQNNLVNRPGLQQIWNNPDLRQKLTAMLQAWNSALKSTAAERLGDVACMLEKLLHQTTPFDVENTAPLAATQSPAETPQQAIDRLLDFPSRRLAVYGSLAPGKKTIT